MKVEALIATIDDFFSDTTRSKSETRAGLEEVTEHIKILLGDLEVLEDMEVLDEFEEADEF